MKEVKRASLGEGGWRGMFTYICFKFCSSTRQFKKVMKILCVQSYLDGGLLSHRARLSLTKKI